MSQFSNKTKFLALVAVTLLLSSHFFSQKTQAQSLPDEMQIVEDPTGTTRLVSGGNTTTGFYDESEIQSIELEFSQPNYWSLMLNNYEDGINIPATVIINGETYEEVGVRFRGNTSFSMNNSDKKSIGITLDYTDATLDVNGYETLNLNCGFQDRSSLREILFNHVGRNYTPGLKANFATLTINGENWGPYTNVQQLNGDYIREWFMSNDGTRWRALDPNFTMGGGGPGGPGGPGGNPFGTGESTLNYNGPDSTDYNEHYTLKYTTKDDPWEDLIETCDKLNNLPLADIPEQLPDYLDIDKALWFLAHEIIFGDDDSYAWKGGMDYYVFWEAETDRIIPLEYDGNTVLGNETVNWSPFFNENDPEFPLMNRLFAVPELRQRYLAHVRTILNDYFVVEDLHNKIDEYFAMIDPLVDADPKKIYPYNQFLNGVNELKEIIEDRHAYLSSHAEVAVTGVELSNAIPWANGTAYATPQANEELNITIAVNSTTGITAQKVYLYYATGIVGRFTKIEMHDDGMHNDAGADDGFYGAYIPGFSGNTYVRYYIEAIADNAAGTATYEPKGAEHDVYIYRVEPTVLQNNPLVINEFMASNDATVADQDGEFDDWIELYNNSGTALDLSGWYLSDNPDNLTKWEFPTGTTINANGYLIIWADEDGQQDGLHANFKLSSAGETVYLLNPDVELAQEITYEAQQTDMGYARIPNGTGAFVIQAPTFGANNEFAVGIDTPQAAANTLQIYPNPADAQFIIKSLSPQAHTLNIYNLLGKNVYQAPFNGQSTIDVSDWQSGLYFVQIGGELRKVVVE